MTTISPNYAGVNFRATEQPKKAETVNAQTKTASKGMSNAAKAGIGLAALATVAVAGLAIKKGLNKPISINTRQLFEHAFGKIEDGGGQLEANDVIGCAKHLIDEIKKDTGKEVKHTSLIKLDEKGLGLLKKHMNVDVSKEIFGEKKALLLQFFDKDAKLLKSKPIFADSFDKSLSNLFGKESVVKLG